MALADRRQNWTLGRLVHHISRYDWWLILAMMVLIIAGGMSIYSIDQAATGRDVRFLTSHLLRLAVGVIPFGLMLFVRPTFWRRASPFLYVFNLGLLVLVLFAGRTAGGAQRWVEVGPLDFQPSELAKLLVIITLSTFYANRIDQIKQLRTFLLGFAHVALPMALIYKQPHLGATLVLLAIWLGVSLIAGVPVRFVVVAIVVGILALVAAVKIPLLDAYQLKRILGLFQPDSKTTGFHTKQAELAFGSGGFSGTGFLNGEQKAGHYVPEQETDFIFTVIGEEGGFIGSLLILATFAFFFYRLWWIMFNCRSSFHQMAMAGILTMFTFHTFANLGMLLRLLPVVGLWLPFLSYGGTAIWLCLACVALALNIKQNEDVEDQFSSRIT